MERPAVPPPRDFDERPFYVGDELSIFDAAMIYSGRHPAPVFLKNSSIDDHLSFLKAGVSDSATRKRIRAHRSWDILCALIERIARNDIYAIKYSYDKRGRINPLLTTIRTLDPVDLAAERREHPKYLKHLMPNDAHLKSRRLTKRIAREFTDEYIEKEKTAGRKPTLKRLEEATVKANLSGNRDYLRCEFRKKMRAGGTPVRRGRPKNATS